MNSSLAIPLSLPRRGLQRILGVTFGIAIGVGAMIGSGILRTGSVKPNVSGLNISNIWPLARIMQRFDRYVARSAVFGCR
jgi:hypothetical protein